ncbi:MAG: discoidin domain-containing protein [Acidobacteria bacterium]|nr:discoidin domain-containing protein [Acidobacteriota bacterium]
MKKAKSLSLLAPMLGILLVSVLPAAAAEKGNIALRRAAWHSSAANVDNTAQLVSDGVLGVLSGEVIDTGGTSASNPTYGQMVPGRVESEWISAGGGEEWVHLDLGADAGIGRVTVHWGSSYALDYDLQISDDARAWQTIAGARGRAGEAVETEVDVRARYLRVLCRTSSGTDYRIREIEVGGESGPHYRLPPQPAPAPDGSQRLTGGNWKIERASLVHSDGAALSAAGYDDSGWLPATVPGTAFVSWLRAGAVPDPYYDDWQFQASDIFFTADFWYRNSFEIPEGRRGRRVYLDFDAVNWKADVWLNGRRLENNLEGYAHSIEGAFIRARFDVTELARFGGPNFLAVRIYRNRTPGLVTTQGLAEGPLPNGGELGQDNPTLHAAVGWDWLPTIRGRGIGIYNDVTVTYGGGVQLENAWMETDLDIAPVSAGISAPNLALGRTVTQPAAQGADPAHVVDGDDGTQWIGADQDGAGFTVDLGAPTAIGSLELVWGSEAGGAAASAESRHPARFRVQVSDDGARWRNFDSWAGGEVNTGWFGPRQADASPGTEEYAGAEISNSVPGPAASVKVSFAGNDAFPMRIPVTQTARYVRFVASRRREVPEEGNRVVPARVREIRVYAETAEEVARSLVRTYRLDPSQADLTFRADLHNYGPEPAEVTLEGVVAPGGLRFSRTVHVPARTKREVVIDGILMDDPDLWWPNTYGRQPLYTATVTARAGGATEDRTSFRFGVREFTYPIDGNRLTIYCNGTRIVAKGGNWGMDDGLKTDTPEKYDDKMRLHAEANFTMVRNWVGMTNHRAFYEAADRYGILLWDDFWLANPVDGPNPDDERMFLDNAVDKIRKVRRHPSLALYCGRNEAAPPKPLDDGLRRLTRDDDGTRIYIPNSAADPVGSGGGYAIAAMPNRNDGAGIREYFDEVPYVTLRSECGIPNVPSLESMKKFLPGEKLWPINESWALHDWTYHMNGPANTYMDALQLYTPGGFSVPTDRVQGQKPDPSDPVFARYRKEILEMAAAAGRAYTLEEFQKMAQMINYENFKGVYEGLTVKRSNGFLMWMSQSSWPSFMWQTYDWYLDTNAGYFGARAANQPTHAVWDPRDDAVVLSNLSTTAYSGVVTSLSVFDLDGRPVAGREWTTPALAPDSYGIRLGTADFSKSPTDLVFIRLTVRDGAGRRLGDNLYWHNRKDYMRYEALNRLPEVRLGVTVSARGTVAGERGRGNHRYTLTFRNDGPAPAVQTRIRTLAGGTGRDILPAFYSDNYFGLMPGESKTVTVEFDPRCLEGERPVFGLGGWNTRPETIGPAE